MKVMVVGSFDMATQNRHEMEQAYAFQLRGDEVITFDYRKCLYQCGDIITMMGMFLTYVGHSGVELVLINSGSNMAPKMIDNFRSSNPHVKFHLWQHDYTDNAPDKWLVEMFRAMDAGWWTLDIPMIARFYLDRKSRPANYLPTPHHPAFFYQMNVEKRYDVVFLGTPHYDYRREVIEYLLDAGIDVTVFGNGNWGSKIKARPGVYGRMCNLVMNQAKIVLNINKHVYHKHVVSDRMYLALATRTFSVANRNKGINDIIPNDTGHVFWNELPQCVDIIKSYASESDRQEIIDEGVEYSTTTPHCFLTSALETICEYPT